ncbi:MAG: hypothetical protein HN413_13320 [Chloroflexi bacterium]|jgi:hypothetical protein|nr:hypothetical protein [Chloroflexota bacterium]
MPSERGQALLAFLAIFAFFALVPFMALVGDGARMFVVRSRVQTALDAACEDGAWNATDRAVFRDTGTIAFIPQDEIVTLATNTFYRTLVEMGAANYSASITVTPLLDQLRVDCESHVNVPLLIMDWDVPFEVLTDSSIRSQ